MLLILVWLVWPKGYGSVSDQSCEVANALYTACMTESDEHLARVDQLLQEEAETGKLDLPTQERQWLEQIVRTAQKGRWKAAAKKARLMMEQQQKVLR